MNLEYSSIFSSCSFKAFFFANLLLTSWMSSSNSLCLSYDFFIFCSFLASAFDNSFPAIMMLSTASSVGSFFFHDQSVSCFGLIMVISSFNCCCSLKAKVKAAGISFFFIGIPCAIGITCSSLVSNLLLTESSFPPFKIGSICDFCVSSFLLNSSFATFFTDPILGVDFFTSSSSSFF